jgi:hypothetical protein
MQVGVLRHVAHPRRTLCIDWQFGDVGVEHTVGGEEGTRGARDRLSLNGSRDRETQRSCDKH